MANALFTLTKGVILDGGINFGTATLKVSLIDSADVTLNTATHDFYDDASAGVVATATLSSVTTSTAGVLDSADPVFSAATGDQSEQVILWNDTAGAASTDHLCAFYDTFGSGMPVTPNGGDITLQVHSSGYFAL